MWRCGDPVAVLVDCQLGRLAFAPGVVPPTVAPPRMTFIRRIDLSPSARRAYQRGWHHGGLRDVAGRNQTTPRSPSRTCSSSCSSPPRSPLWIAIAHVACGDAGVQLLLFPPAGTLTIADPQNWIALFAFLAVSLVASRLSAAARDRQREASSRRDELARLFDLSRDILLTTEPGRRRSAILARHISSRFQLDYVSICLPAGAGFRRVRGRVLDLGHLLTTG